MLTEGNERIGTCDRSSDGGRITFRIPLSEVNLPVVEQLIRSITFSTTAKAPPGNIVEKRIVSLQVELGGMLIVDEVTVEVGPPLFSTSEELQRRKIVEGAAPCAFGPWTILAPWSLSPMDCFNGGFFSFRIVQGGGPEDRIYIRQDRTTAEGILLRETQSR